MLRRLRPHRGQRHARVADRGTAARASVCTHAATVKPHGNPVHET
jgi:hypothetical protein